MPAPSIHVLEESTAPSQVCGPGGRQVQRRQAAADGDQAQIFRVGRLSPRPTATTFGSVRTRHLIALLVACSTVCPVGVASAATGADAVARLNEQRAAHGIPTGIVHNAEWSRWCALHNEYQRLNGGRLTHSEDPDKPGYTPEGDRAARASVLSSGDDWDGPNPWETAPIHLHQLLAPRLDAMGVDDSNRFVCATTLLSRNRPAPEANAVYTYPGQGTVHRYEELAAEGPYTPGERVGIPKGTTTGPYIYVSVDGPQLTPFSTARIVSASLSGPDGAVELRVVDNHTSGLEGYLPPGGQLIPVSPLRARSSYTATVNLKARGGGGEEIPFERTWSFSTVGRSPGTVWEVGLGEDTPPVVAASSDSPAPIVLTATRPATGEQATRPLRSGEDTPLDLRPGTWELCVRQEAEGEFESFHECRSEPVAIGQRLKIKLGKRPARTRSSLVIPVTAGPELEGQSVAANITRYKRVCSRRRSYPGGPLRRTCKQKKAGSSIKRTLVASAAFSVKAPRPARGGSVVVRLVAAAFRSGDVPYTVTSVSRRYVP